MVIKGFMGGFGQAFKEAKRAYFSLISNVEVNQIVFDMKGVPLGEGCWLIRANAMST
jgi:hypothetical protein